MTMIEFQAENIAKVNEALEKDTYGEYGDVNTTGEVLQIVLL